MNRLFPGRILFSLGLAWVTLGCAAGSPPDSENNCQLSESNQAFVSQSYVLWNRAATDLLEIDPEPFPWWVAFDRQCVWHINPDWNHDVVSGLERREIAVATVKLPVAVGRHHEAVEAPDGNGYPMTGMAFAGLYAENSASFFMMALPNVWRLDPNADKHPNLQNILLGVVSHEIIHTRQMAQLNREVEALGMEYPLPESMNDDIVEERFSSDAEFSRHMEQEIDQYYVAARMQRGPAQKNAIVEALRLSAERRAKYFCGDDIVLGYLEDLFLNLEGVATWTSHALGYGTEADEDLVRGRNAWVQDAGLVLSILVAEWVPDWRDQMMGSEMNSQFALLAAAVEFPGGWDAAPCSRLAN